MLSKAVAAIALSCVIVDANLRGIFEKKENILGHRWFKEGRRLISSGDLKNLVICIRFADHKDRAIPSQEELQELYNSEEGLSVKHVYRVNSNDQLNIETTVTPWIDLPKSEKYYSGGDSAKGSTAILEAVRYALQELDDKNYISFEEYDQDDDGELDLFNVVHSGYDANKPRTDCFGNKRRNRIWSQKRPMPTWSSKEGIEVNEYSLNPALDGTCGGDISHVGVIVHELGHFLGISDLYDRDGGGRGVGAWGMMGSSIGWDGSGNFPPIMTAPTRAMLGWVEIFVIDKDGQYELEASSKSPRVFMIDRGFGEDEFLLLENRQPDSFDSLLPQGGIAVWHVDEDAGESYTFCNTREGFPSQKNWPQNGNHYAIALLQADGQYDLEKGENRGDEFDLFHGDGVDRLGPSVDTNGPYPNTDSYSDGIIRKTGVLIENISVSGPKMTFDVRFLDV